MTTQTATEATAATAAKTIEKTLVIGEDPEGHRVTLELELKHKGPELTTTGQVIERQTVDGQKITEYDELSICGTSRYSGGQIRDTVRKELPGYRQLYIPEVSVLRILAIWDRWHLNDMKAACVHQGASWDLSEKITVTRYQIDWSALRQLERLIKRDYARQNGHPPKEDYSKDLALLKAASQWSPAADMLLTVRLLGLEAFSWKTMDPKYYAQITRKVRGWHPSKLVSTAGGDDDFNLSSHIKVETETKNVAWLRPEEHEKGLLGRPCQVCGYKYGTSWLVCALPEEIKQEIIALFDSGAASQPTEPEADSIEAFIAAHGIGFECQSVASRPDGGGEWGEGSRHFRCRITKGRRGFGLYYSQGSAHTEEPTVEDVLNCLARDAQDYENANGFEDWARDMGFDTDSRKGERMYRNLGRQAEQLKRTIGADNYRVLLEEVHCD